MRLKFILLLLLSVLTTANGQIIELSMPIDRGVYQRNGSTATSSAYVDIMGQVPTQWQSTWTLQYKVVKLSKAGVEGADLISWTNLPNPGLGKTFRVRPNIVTGWYKLYVRLLQSGNTISSFNRKFGVGEVLIIAGQSNAAGEGPVDYSNEQDVSPNPNTGQDYDCIITSTQTASNKCSGKLPVYPVLTTLNNSTSFISPNGFQPWVYNMLATKIVDGTTGLVVPVLVFNTGLSGSSVNQWSESANNPTTSYSTDPYGINRCNTSNLGNGFGLGEPFRTLRNSLNFYGSLFGMRGVIWHQGESDNYLNTLSTNYQSNLNNVISKSRSNFNANLPWVISKVSWDGSTSDSQVTIGQDGSRSSSPNNSNGTMNSDIYTGAAYRQVAPANTYSDGLNVHFNINGLNILSTDYKNNLFPSSPGSSLSSKTPIPANPIVPVTFTQMGASKVVSLDFGAIGKSASNFSCFFWTTGNDYTAITYPNDGCSSVSPYNGTSLTVSSNGQWRCYMRETSTGNVYMTQKLNVNVNSSVRVASSGINSTVYPNPASADFEKTIQFNLIEPSHVKLEILDKTGRVLKELANAEHESGKYKYPFTLKSEDFKTLDQVYYRLTINDQAITHRILIE